MNRIIDQLSSSVVGAVIGLYCYSCFATGGVVRHVGAQIVYRMQFEAWTAVVLIVAMLLLLRLHFLIVAPVMMALTELYRITPVDTFQDALEKITSAYTGSFPQFIMSSHFLMAFVCLLLVSVVDVLNQLHRHQRKGENK